MREVDYQTLLLWRYLDRVSWPIRLAAFVGVSGVSGN